RRLPLEQLRRPRPRAPRSAAGPDRGVRGPREDPQNPPAPVVGLCPPDPFGRGAGRHPALVLVRAPLRDILMGRSARDPVGPRPDDPAPRAAAQDADCGPVMGVSRVPPDRALTRAWGSDQVPGLTPEVLV